MKRLFIFVFSLILCIPIYQVTPLADETASETEYSFDSVEFPTLASPFIVVMDADSGELLYNRNGNTQVHPASTTKLMTALLTIENCKMDDVVTYSANAVNSIEPGFANASVSEGEEFTVKQSLYCLILRSANEVAYGLAEHVGGSIANFARMMNDRAASLGATNTHFSNPSGLTDANHYTSAYDMALIARACFNNKALMEIVGYNDTYVIGPTNKSRFTRYYKHRYQMMPGGDYAYPYSCGGKTGYTDAAGNCLVSFAQKDGLRLICVVMNGAEDGRYYDTRALFDYYFNNFHKEFLNESTLNLPDYINLDSANYLLVPNGVDFDELTRKMKYSDQCEAFAIANYYYNDTYIGKMIFSVKPAPENEARGEDIFYINILYLICGVLGVTALTFIIIVICKKRHKYNNKTTKKLRF